MTYNYTLPKQRFLGLPLIESYTIFRLDRGCNLGSYGVQAFRICRGRERVVNRKTGVLSVVQGM